MYKASRLFALATLKGCPFVGVTLFFASSTAVQWLTISAQLQFRIPALHRNRNIALLTSKVGSRLSNKLPSLVNLLIRVSELTEGSHSRRFDLGGSLFQQLIVKRVHLLYPRLSLRVSSVTKVANLLEEDGRIFRFGLLGGRLLGS